MKGYLKVTEVYPAIRGEGINIGNYSLIVRLSGCNLRCSYCDTEYSWHDGEELTVGELVSVVREYDPRLIVWTGGEPLLQQAELYKAVEMLNNYHELETNGTIIPRKPYLFDLIVVSPKGKINYERFIEMSNAIFVYPTDNPYETIKIVEQNEIEADRVYFMPIILNDTDALHVLSEHRRIARFCTKHGVNFTPRLQSLFRHTGEKNGTENITDKRI